MCITEFDEEVYEKGIREEEREIGKAEGKAEDVLELLEDCGEPSESLRKLIMGQTDLSILRQWHKAAARAESIEDFEKKIGLIEK